MRRGLISSSLVAAVSLSSSLAFAQGYPGGSPGMVGAGARSPREQIQTTPLEEKPDKAAAKAYAAGMKNMNKAHEQEAILAKETDADKRGRARGKLDDLYDRAMAEFTQVLRNQ